MFHVSDIAHSLDRCQTEDHESNVEVGWEGGEKEVVNEEAGEENFQKEEREKKVEFSCWILSNFGGRGGLA